MISDNKIRFIRSYEINLLQDFIKKNYISNHILSSNKKVLNFYYNFQNKRKINFLGYFSKNKLSAVMGLISSKNWDSSSDKKIFIALIAKAEFCKEDISFKFISYIFNKIKPNFLGCIGFNSKVFKIFSKIGLCKKMEHYYILNKKIKTKISKNLLISRSEPVDNIKIKITKVLKEIPSNKIFQSKSKNYFNNKYFLNPFYRYYFLNVYKNKKFIFFLVARKIKVKKYNSFIFRIVDIYGQEFNVNISYLLEKFLYKNKAEYIDFMNYGIESSILKLMGFQKKKSSQLLPNYFEPFIKKNENLDLCILFNKSNNKKVIINKGDGDQDRPNRI